MSWSPQDLPFIREVCARETGKLAEQFDHIKHTGGAGLPAKVLEAAEQAAQSARMTSTMLHAADLTWLDDDVSRMVADTVEGLPEWTPSAAMPTPCGLMAFETPPLKSPNAEIGEVEVSAIVWGVHGDMVAILWLADGKKFPTDGTHIPLVDVATAFVRVDEPVAADNPVAALAGAAWLLIGQRSMVDDAPPVTVRVKQRKRGNRAPVKYREVSVTYKKLHDAYRGESTGAGTGRRATRRWWVRGHWRQQPWGRGRLLRKPVFIAPYVAGNPAAPVDERPSVQVIREGEA